MIQKEEKNKLLPWMKNGKWYHFFIESDGENVTLTTYDLEEVQMSGLQALLFPADFHILDFILDINALEDAGTSSYNKGIKFNGNKQMVTLPGKTVYDYMDVYVFGHF